jgi:hypothetical protein
MVKMPSVMPSVIGHAHAVVQPAACEPGQILVRAAARVGADQHPPAQPPWQLRQREPGRLDVLAGGVRSGVAGPQVS